ncbi:MAG: LytR/AlgR family response regulator transcription factor [Salibacteraceae bacterium]
MIHVFIVEDNSRHLMTLEAKVKNLGYGIAGTSTNSRDALAAFAKTNTDVVLLDIHLEDGLNGIDLAVKMREINEVPIIFVTAMQASSVVEQAMPVVPSGYLVKPVHPMELKANIELALEQQKHLVVATPDQHYLTVRLGQKLRKLRFEDISHLKVESKNYVTLVDKHQKQFPVRGSLKKLLEGVLPMTFLRTHHGHVINLDYVDYIDETTQSMYLLTGDVVPIGRIFKKEVYTRMNIN